MALRRGRGADRLCGRGDERHGAHRRHGENLTADFTVTLARSERTFTIPPGASVLEVLLDAGLDVPYSCMQGICGTCETRVLAGRPDHQDRILSDDERAGGKTMMICCSRALSPELVLDL